MPCWPWRPYWGAVTLDSRPFGIAASVRCDPANPVSNDLKGISLPPPDKDGLSLVGQWNLFNAVDLAGQLSLSCNDVDSDALIRKGYCRWGDSLGEHLDGEFSFAIVDLNRHLVFACRDPLGVLPFIYSRQGSTFYFAGDMRTMLRTAPISRALNAGSLHAVAAMSRVRPVEGETYHRGIFTLPPGSSIVVDRENARVRKYWEPSIRPNLVPKRDEEVFETARYLAERAVTRRIAGRGKVALLFSGGLDSASLAICASKYLRERNEVLTALSFVKDPAYGHVDDEQPWIAQMSGIENMEIQYVSASGHGPFDGLDEAGRYETSCSSHMPYFYRPLIAAAESCGADILLSGNFGESTISGRPTPFFWEFAARGQWSKLSRELRLSGSRTGVSAWKYLAAEAWQHFRPKAAFRNPFFLSKAFMATASDLPPAPRAPWSLDSRRHALQTVRDYLAREGLRSTQPPESFFNNTRPYCDKDLLEFTLALPAEFKGRDGYRRYLVRKSFEDVLPPGTAWRRGKMWAVPDYYERFNAQLGKAREFVRAIRKSDPVREIVDVAALSAALCPVTAELMTPGRRVVNFDALFRIPTTMQLICFLRQFPGLRA